MFTKILVPIDGSELAYKCVEYALDLAEKYSATVKVITVVDMPSSTLLSQSSAFTPDSLKNYEENLITRHKKNLLLAIKKARKINPHISITKELLQGPPGEKIIETSKDESFDLIVIGNRGLGGIKEFLLGSVSDKVADEAPCPVLIVKQTDKKDN